MSGRVLKTHEKNPSDVSAVKSTNPTKMFKTYDATSPKRTLVTKKPLRSVIKKNPRLLTKYLQGPKS